MLGRRPNRAQQVPALAAHDPNDRVDQLVILTERLTDLIAKEATAFEYRRPQDALLAIQGLRIDEEKAAADSLSGGGEEAREKPFSVACSDVDSDHEHVQRLFNAMVDARSKAGDAGAGSANFDSFKAFVKKKTEQIRKDYGCHAVEYSVEMEGGQVRLKAKAKTT